MNSPPASSRVLLVDERGENLEVDWLGRVAGAAALGGVQLHHAQTTDGRHVFAKVVRVTPMLAYDVDDLGRAARETGYLRLHQIAECEYIVRLEFAGFASVPGVGLAHVRLMPFAEGGSLRDQIARRSTDAATQEAVEAALATPQHSVDVVPVQWKTDATCPTVRRTGVPSSGTVCAFISSFRSVDKTNDPRRFVSLRFG